MTWPDLIHQTPGLSNAWFIQHLVYLTHFMRSRCGRINKGPQSLHFVSMDYIHTNSISCCQHFGAPDLNSYNSQCCLTRRNNPMWVLHEEITQCWVISSCKTHEMHCSSIGPPLSLQTHLPWWPNQNQVLVRPEPNCSTRKGKSTSHSEWDFWQWRRRLERLGCWCVQTQWPKRHCWACTSLHPHHFNSWRKI